MSNTYFRFKQFVVNQDKCAMKVGTDGTLLGAWAHGGKRILDIGTGTGLIALMMAQRFPESRVVALDIDEEACQQAQENVALSPFAERIAVSCQSLQEYAKAAPEARFDAIVCNPPFFLHSLKSPDDRRTTARHADTLPHADLFACVSQLLSDEGEFSVIIPFDVMKAFDTQAVLSGFFPARICAFRTSQRKPIRRYLVSYKQHFCKVEEQEMLLASEQYRELLSDFYL